MKKIFSVVCGLSLLTACNNGNEKTNLSIDQFEKGIADSTAQVLDVRTPGEYQSGHLHNAFLANWNDRAEFESRVKSLDKKRPVYTYCLSGARSNAATGWLRDNGYTAFNLSGGILAWRNAGKTLEQVETVRQLSLPEYMLNIPSNKTVLVDFSATWCPPCKVMAPIIDSMAKADSSRFVLVKIDGGQQTNICNELKIDAFPTFLVYKAGQETWRAQGITEAKEIAAHLK